MDPQKAPHSDRRAPDSSALPSVTTDQSTDDDAYDEADDESFPASDPPSAIEPGL